MIDFFDRLYALIINRNKFLSRIRFYSVLRFFIRLSANKILPIYFYFTRKKTCYSLGIPQNRENRIIVSMTSFPKRILKVWLAIESILRQSEKPDQIILWLSKEQFRSIDSLPYRLLQQRERGLQIMLKEGDIRSHKKYFYTIQEFPDDIMITLDDDIFYPKNTIEGLIKWNNAYPDSIIARYGTKIKIVDSKITPYKFWEQEYNNALPSFKFFFGSGGGTLFPPRSLAEDTINKDLFMDLCPTADDIWLNTMCRLNNRKVFITKEKLCSTLPIINKENVSLATINLQANLNDVQLKNVRDYFLSNKGIDPYLVSLNEFQPIG